MKIFCDYPEVVQAALLENIVDLQFVELADEADFVISKHNFPLRISVLIDEINSHRVIKVSGLDINFAAQQLVFSGKNVAMTEKETEIMKHLIDKPNGLSKEQMLQKIWQYATGSNTATVETHIYRLKTKIAQICDAEIIQHVDGVYRLVK